MLGRKHIRRGLGGSGVRIARALAACTALLACGCIGRGQNNSVERTTRIVPEERVNEAAPVQRQLLPETTTGFSWDGKYAYDTAEGPFEVVLDESIRTLRKLKFKLDPKESRSGADFAVLAGTDDERHLSAVIGLRKLETGKTRVRVLVGKFGDRNGSERFLNEIRDALEKRVKKSAPAPKLPAPAQKTQTPPAPKK